MNKHQYLLPLVASTLALSACNFEQQLEVNAQQLQINQCASNTSCVPGIDVTAPTLAQVVAVATPTADSTPEYTFSSTEAGSISYGGSCDSVTTAAVAGSNTISFSTLAAGSYSGCTITVTDGSGNSSAVLAINAFTIVPPNPLNDTGITTCGDYANSAEGYSGTSSNQVNCSVVGSTQTVAGIEASNDPVPAGQDAVYGRDANPATNSSSDGHKGFSFTKLGADGQPLAIQGGTWNDAGSEAAGTKWSCVMDNVTGLIWEVKTNDSGLRDKDWTYTWYNSNGSANGGNAGTQDTGAGVGSDNCANNARCDTEKYVADVNTAMLCGASNWRMPRAEELHSIISDDRMDPSVDTLFFANTLNTYYWASESMSNPASNTLALRVWFSYSYISGVAKSTQQPVRLVRRNQ